MQIQTSSLRMTILLISGAVILCVTVFGTCCAVRKQAQDALFGKSREKRIQLLYRTDHKALLAACRELSRRVANGTLKEGRYRFQPHADPEVSSFPRAMLDLEPSTVTMSAHGIFVAVAGGLDHFGVAAWASDRNESPLSGKGKELITGLWYYDDGYDEDPDYDKKLEALRPK